MAKLSLGTIFIGRNNFDIVNEMLIKGRMKNYSIVIDTIITHYLNISGHNDKLVERIAQLNKEIAELKSTINSYRGQIIQK